MHLDLLVMGGAGSARRSPSRNPRPLRPMLAGSLALILGLGVGACDEDEPEPAATETTAFTTGPDWSTGSSGTTSPGGATTFDPSDGSGDLSGTTGSSTGTSGGDQGGTTTVGPTSTGTTSGTGTDTGMGSTESSGGSDTTGPAACDGAFQCVAHAPEGWMGPVARSSSDDADADPGCGLAWSNPSGAVSFAELSYEPLECRTCSCGAVEDIECGVVEAEFFRGSSCGGSSAGDAAIDSTESCVALDLSGSSSTSVQLSALGIADGANCPASDTKVTERPDPSWGNVVQACAADPVDFGMCAEGSTCMPTVDAELTAGLCIYAEGDQACPEGPYSQRSLRYTGSNDERSCADCSCGAPEGDLACKGNLVLYTADNCGSSGDSKGVAKLEAEQCVELAFANDQAPASARIGQATPTGSGRCTPMGGDAIGEVLPTGVMTFCCSE